MSKSEFIKKVVIKSERSSAAARAERLRRLRHLANFSRQQLCDAAEVKLPSLTRWELGLYGGLPVDGAIKIIASVAQQGVQCSLDWLLHEEGPSPRLIDSQNSVLGEKNPIDNELALFTQYYPTGIDCLITDDGMLPLYQVGERVAGLPYYGDEISSTLGLSCIVKVLTGEKVVRKVQAGTQPKTFNLVCVNSQTKVAEPIIFNVKLLYAAPILRVYRNPNQ